MTILTTEGETLPDDFEGFVVVTTPCGHSHFYTARGRTDWELLTDDAVTIDFGSNVQTPKPVVGQDLIVTFTGPDLTDEERPDRTGQALNCQAVISIDIVKEGN